MPVKGFAFRFLIAGSPFLIAGTSSLTVGRSLVITLRHEVEPFIRMRGFTSSILIKRSRFLMPARSVLIASCRRANASSWLKVFGPDGIALRTGPLPCDTRFMAIEDHLPRTRSPKTTHAPSNVRSKLRSLANALEVATLAKAQFAVANGAVLSRAQVVAEIAEARAEWDRLDTLLNAAKLQRQHIETRLAAFMDFIVLIRMHIRNRDRKPRRRLTSAEKIIAMAKLRQTRALRHTMGKRQKKHLKA